MHHTTQNPAQQTAVDNKLWNLLGWPPNTKSCPIVKLPNTTRGATCYLAGRPHNILSNSVLCNMLPNWSPNTKCYPSNPSTHHTAHHNMLWNLLPILPPQNNILLPRKCSTWHVAQHNAHHNMLSNVLPSSLSNMWLNTTYCPTNCRILPNTACYPSFHSTQYTAHRNMLSSMLPNWPPSTNAVNHLAQHNTLPNWSPNTICWEAYYPTGRTTQHATHDTAKHNLLPTGGQAQYAEQRATQLIAQDSMLPIILLKTT